MTRLNHSLNLIRGRSHHRRIGDREENLFHCGRVREIPAYGVGNHHGIFNHFGLSESVHTLPESSNNGEGQSAELDDLADSLLLRSIERLSHFLCDDAHLVMSLLVLRVKKSSREHYQIAHKTVLGIRTEDLDIAFLASTDGNWLAQRNHRRCGDDARHSLLRGFHVGAG